MFGGFSEAFCRHVPLAHAACGRLWMHCGKRRSKQLIHELPAGAGFGVGKWNLVGSLPEPSLALYSLTVGPPRRFL